jgi:4-amino-4-deoxy-L-arabinose transferase-like glycosyltransferase
MTLLTNAPMWLLVMLPLIGVVLLGSGVQRDQKRLRAWGFGLILAAVVLAVVRWTVPTDEKRVQRKTRDLVAAVSHQDWKTVDQLLKHASMMGWEGDELARQTQRFAEEYQLQSVGITSMSVQQQPQVFVATLSVISHHHSDMYDTVQSTWRLEYQKRLEGWVVTSITPVKIGMASASEAESLLRSR